MHRSSGSVGKAPSPNSAAYRKTFMTRRHSSGTSDTPIVRDTSPHAACLPPGILNNNNGGPCGTANMIGGGPMSTSFHHHGSYPLVTDERRWSIANPPAESCRRPSSLFVSTFLLSFLFLFSKLSFEAASASCLWGALFLIIWACALWRRQFLRPLFTVTEFASSSLGLMNFGNYLLNSC